MSFLKSPYWEAMGIMGSVIIGSGIFVLPYAVSVSGLWAGIAMGMLALFLVLSIHLAYGEIVSNTEERHRLPGYSKLYLGRWVGNLSKITELLLFNSVLLTYAILGGFFLSVVFGGNPHFWSSLFFLGAVSVLLFSRVERIGLINFLIMILVILTEISIAVFAFKSGTLDNLPFYGKNPFFSFGVFVFALAGLSVIADAREIFQRGKIEHKLKSVIIMLSSFPFLLYIFFTISILMVTGKNITGNVFSGLAQILGGRIIIVGALISAFSMFSSFLALGYDLKRIYELDFNLSKFMSWVLTALVPIIIFIFNAGDFVKIISIVGGIFISIDGILVFLILRKLRSLGISREKFLPFNFLHQILLASALLLSIFYEFFYQVL